MKIIDISDFFSGVRAGIYTSRKGQGEFLNADYSSSGIKVMCDQHWLCYYINKYPYVGWTFGGMEEMYRE